MHLWFLFILNWSLQPFSQDYWFDWLFKKKANKQVNRQQQHCKQLVCIYKDFTFFFNCIHHAAYIHNWSLQPFSQNYWLDWLFKKKAYKQVNRQQQHCKQLVCIYRDFTFSFNCIHHTAYIHNWSLQPFSQDYWLL